MFKSTCFSWWSFNLSLNEYFGNILDENKTASDELLNEFLIKTEANSDFKTLKPLLLKYSKLLKQSKEILKTVPAVVKSKQDAKAFETLFKFHNSPEGRQAAEQQRLSVEKNYLLTKLTSLRDHYKIKP